ncbi:hypothetical protein BTA51_29000, partial [Hahella sp. CCB-MM4]|uniref:terpene synthase family protein n=1 Tax=Hahella sp. (strain CCB-MM4) TaxID=1926491 RepID=UPI000BD19EE0
MSPPGRKSYRRHLADWDRTNTEAGSPRAHSARPPAPDEYVPWRRISSPVIWHFDLVEYARGRELPDGFVGGEAHRQLVECAADVAAWTNDLFSAPKELSREERCNLVAVLAHHHGTGVQEAALATVERIGERVRDFLDARAALLAGGGADPAGT